MEDAIEQMKRIQLRIGASIDNSINKDKSLNQNSQIVGGDGIDVKTDGNKISISQSQK